MGSSGSTTVGYAYFLDFTYVYCTRIDDLYAILKDGTIEWGDPYIASGTPSSITFITGKASTIYGSGFSTSEVKLYPGDQSSITEMSAWTGLTIGYRDTCALVFSQAFIGDNVQTVPKYSMISGNNTYEHISNYHIMPDGNANPIDVIYNILIVDLGMDTTLIDTASFEAAAWTVYDEELSVGLLMGTTKKVMSWIEDMLAVVDGVIFLDSVTNQLKVKLLRDDYDINTIVALDDSNTSKVVLESTSWAETYNKFVLKYTYLLTGKETSVEFINTASRNALGYDRVKTISYPAVNSGAVLSKIANRVVAKMGTPLAAIKASVNYIDYPNINIGDVIKFSSDRLGVVDKVFRVLKITGDNEEQPTINVEGIEDIFSKSFTINVPDNDDGYEYVPPNYSLTAPKRYTVKDAQREMVIGDGVVWFATKGDESEFVLSANCVQVGGASDSAPPMYYGTLASIIPADITGLDGALVSSAEYNADYQFTINDIDGALFEFFGTTTTLQNLRHVAYIGDEEFSFKTIEDLGGGIFQVTGVIRGLNDTSMVEHTIGTGIFISASDGRFTSVLGINTATPSLSIFMHNHTEVGPAVAVSPTYTFTSSKPYNPVPKQTVWGDTKTVSWRPRVALAGANYRNEDRIVGGEDEGLVTGYYEVTYPNAVVETINPVQGDTLISFDTTQTGNHYITHKNLLTHRYDSVVTINVT